MARFRPAPLHAFRSGLARLLLVLPFLVMALLPAGVMPGRAADGTLVMVLCTDAGPVEMVVDLATGAATETPASGSGAPPCDWAAAQAAVVLAQTVAMPGPPGVIRRADAVLPSLPPIHAGAPQARFARGPPILS
jgi:hypothetical protein